MHLTLVVTVDEGLGHRITEVAEDLASPLHVAGGGLLNGARPETSAARQHAAEAGLAVSVSGGGVERPAPLASQAHCSRLAAETAFRRSWSVVVMSSPDAATETS